MCHNILLLVGLLPLVVAGCGGSHLAPLRVDSPYLDLGALEKGQIVHLATGRSVSLEELVDNLASHSVVYVGETHDNIEDHRLELTILRELAERYPGEVALGLEMLRRPYQDEVDAYLAGEIGEKEFVRDVWSKSWSLSSWPYYRDILRYARDAGVPVLALNAGKELMKAVRGTPFEELDAEWEERLPEIGPEDPYHRAWAEGIFGGHAGGPKHVDAFLRIQVLWDETMAETAAAYLSGASSRKLVVFAGGAHVRYGFGIPRRLFRRVPLPYVTVETQAVEISEHQHERLMEVELPLLPMPPADFLWAVAYEDLEHERVRLGVLIEDGPDGQVIVKQALPDSPAAKAGLREGDVIVSIDDEPVAETFDVSYQVGLHAPGETGTLEIARDEERLTLEVVYRVPADEHDPSAGGGR